MIKKHSSESTPGWWMLLFIFFSGFSFLQLEVSWFRMLALITGATEIASTLLLAAFMGGFGVGAWFWVHRAKTAPLPHRLLPWLPLSIAILAVLSVGMFRFWLPAAYSFLPEAVAGVMVPVAGWSVLFAAAFFMGGVLPLVVSIFVRNPVRLRRGLGTIYALETTGSALGGLVAGFWLIGALGQTGTVYLAAAINLVSGLMLLLVRSRLLPPPALPDVTVSRKELKNKSIQPTRESNDAAIRWQAGLTVFATGFGVIGLQVLWFRIFKIYMTNSSYTFSLVAAMVIVGLAIGSALFARRNQPPVHARLRLARLLVLMALVTITGFAILVKLPHLVMFPFESLGDNHALRILLIPFLASLLVVVPVSLVSGYLFPMACTLHARSTGEPGQSTGWLLLINALGSILGPLVAAFVLITAFGSGLSVLLMASVFMMAAGLIAGRKKPVWQTIGLASAGVLVLIAMVAPRVKILPPSFGRFPKEILAYRETVGGSFVVGAENKSGNNRVLSTYVNNSAVIGSTYDAVKVVKMVGHLPFFAGLQGSDVLVVGFGIGVTTSAVASHPQVKKIDCVELVAGLKEVSHYYDPLNNGVGNDHRLTLHQGDGRHFLLTTPRRYDLITTDPTHPILGSASLYTREYFELCRAHLNPGGMISQYMPLHKLLPEDFQGILATFREVFPNATVWLGHYHAVLLGFTNDVKIDFRQWSSRMAGVQPDPWFYNDPYALAACFALDGEAIANFFGNRRLLTDDDPYTEYCSLQSFDAENLPANLQLMNASRDGINRLFVNIPDPALMQHYIEGNRLMTEALGRMLSGDQGGFARLMQEAMVINPDNQELRFMMQLGR